MRRALSFQWIAAAAFTGGLLWGWSASASSGSSGSLTISMVVPPMASVSVAAQSPSNPLLTEMKVSANDHFEVSVSSKDLAGEAVRVNGRRQVLSAHESKAFVQLDGGTQTFALLVSPETRARGKGGIIQVNVIHQ